jgi:hypothetical protein
MDRRIHIHLIVHFYMRDIALVKSQGWARYASINCHAIHRFADYVNHLVFDPHINKKTEMMAIRNMYQLPLNGLSNSFLDEI